MISLTIEMSNDTFAGILAVLANHARTKFSDAATKVTVDVAMLPPEHPFVVQVCAAKHAHLQLSLTATVGEATYAAAYAYAIALSFDRTGWDMKDIQALGSALQFAIDDVVMVVRTDVHEGLADQLVRKLTLFEPPEVSGAHLN